MVLRSRNDDIRVKVIIGLRSQRGVVSCRIGHVKSSHVESVTPNSRVLVQKALN